MRFLRPFLLCLAALVGLVALLVVAAFMPSVQTAVAQRVLDRHPELRASVGSVRAGQGELTIRDLALVLDGAILALPSAQAELPVTAALRTRSLHVRHLTAKGWTLDLSGVASPASAPKASSARPASGPAAAPRPTLNPATDVLLVLHHILSHAHLAAEVVIDEVELEGDVLLPVGRDHAPIAVHTIVRGGGLGPERAGSFTVDVQVPLTETTQAFGPLRLNGRLTLALDAAGAPNRVTLEADAATRRNAALDGLHLLAQWSASGGAAPTQSPALQLSRGNRRLVDLAAEFSPAARQLAGTWKVDLHDADLASLPAPRALPGFALTGAGRFNAQLDSARLQVAGKLSGAIERLGALNAALNRVGPTTVSAEFDATHHDHSLRFDRLQISLGGDRPVASTRALQAFEIDEASVALRPSDARADCLEISFQEVPLGWILGDVAGLAFRGGGLRGELGMRLSDGKITVQSKQPLVADGVTVQRHTTKLASDLIFSLPLTAEIASGGWKAKAVPLTVARAGRRLLLFDLSASRAGEDKPLKLDAAWTADMDALAALPNLEHFDFLAGRAASGSFTLLSGARTSFDGKFLFTGRAPDRTLTASLRVSADPGRRSTFSAPIKIAVGKVGSDLNVEGSWPPPGSDAGPVVNLSGDHVALEHLALLVAPLSAAGVVALPANFSAVLREPTVVPGVRDTAPFWGGMRGRVSFDFGHLTAEGEAFTEVGGTVFLEPGAVRLEGGRVVFHEDRRARVEATLVFNPQAALPYRLKGTGSVDEIDAALFLGPPPAGSEPLLHGKFAVALTLAGDGLNFKNLAWRTAEEFHLTSINGGSTRLLETNVAAAISEAPTPVSDAMGTVGSVFGRLLGTKANVLQAEKNPVSPRTDAVLNFTYATKEFRYEQLALTAVRSGDRTIHLDQLELTAASEHVTGTGQIDYVKGRTLAARPLTLDLRLGLRGVPAKFLADAGLLPAKKDAADYTPLDTPLHFIGTLEQLDRSEWRDLLLKAATPPPKKKSE